MSDFVRLIFARHEPVRSFGEHMKSAVGALISMLLVGELAQLTGLPILIAPLGATAVLLFGYPGAALAQPINIFGAYLVATIVSVGLVTVFSPSLPVIAIAVGVTLFLIQTLRVTHPPAGAAPMLAAAAPDHGSLLFIILLFGCIGMVIFALIWHRLPPQRRYPAEHPGAPVQST